jgi:hypothetical protein
VRGAGVELVVAKPRVDSGKRWKPTWWHFSDGEGDGGLMDGGSRISSRSPSRAGSRNGGSGIKGVLKWWRRQRRGPDGSTVRGKQSFAK